MPRIRPLLRRQLSAGQPGHGRARRRLRQFLARGAILCLLAALTASPSVRPRAANPQPYSVTIQPTGKGDLDAAVHQSSLLLSLRESAPVGPFALVARAHDDVQRFQRALQSYGYYDGRVTITIADRPLDDPALPDLLAAIPAGQSVPVKVTLEPGPQFHLRNITLQGEVPPEARAQLGLAPGQPAVAADVLAARERLLKALLDSGHALAKVGDPIATLIPQAQAIDVAMTVDAGPQVDLGPITITGLKQTNPSFVRKRLLIHPGERYNPEEIAAARQDLADIGIFSTVRITAADRLDPAGTLPVEVQVHEAPLHIVQFGISYETDLGGSVSASWTHRNLFGNAERLTLSAAVTGLGGTATPHPGYNFFSRLDIPDWRRRDQTLSFNAQAIREYLTAYNRTAVLGGTTVSRRLNRDLMASVGLAGEFAKIEQEGVTRDYELLQVPISLQYDSTHDLLNPTHGARAAATVTPTHSFANPGATFVIAQASGSVYLDLSGDGRSVFAARGLVGAVEGAATFDIPPDQRFYAGGGGTVRGFKYQSIGPQFPDGVPQGGTSIDVGSIEFRQRFGKNYGAVAFVDAGQVGSGNVPFEGKPQVGAGVGARYYTSFGPLRADIAFPVTRQPHSGSFQLYLGIGQAF